MPKSKFSKRRRKSNASSPLKQHAAKSGSNPSSKSSKTSSGSTTKRHNYNKTSNSPIAGITNNERMKNGTNERDESLPVTDSTTISDQMGMIKQPNNGTTTSSESHQNQESNASTTTPHATNPNFSITAPALGSSSSLQSAPSASRLSAAMKTDTSSAPSNGDASSPNSVTKEQQRRLQQEADYEIESTVQRGTQAFEALEQDFYSILSRLASDKHLESFRAEYKRLHSTLVQSHQNEVRLIKKCHSLNQEILSNAAKVAMALKLSEEDRKTINRLKKELARAWEMVEQTVESDAQSQREIERLHRELSSAEEIITRYRGTDDQFALIEELKNENIKLTTEQQRLTDRLTDVYADYDTTREKFKELEAELAERLRELKTYKNENRIIKMDQDKRDRHRKTLQDSITTQKQKIIDMESQLASSLEKMVEYQDMLDDHKRTIKQKNDIISQRDREINQLNNTVRKMERQMARQLEDQTALLSEKRNLQLDNDTLQKQHNVLLNDLRLLKKEKSKVDFDLHKAQDMHHSDRQYIKDLQRDIDSLKHQIKEYETKSHADATTINSLHVKLGTQQQEKKNLLGKIEEEKDNVKMTKQHVGKLRHHIKDLKKDTKGIQEETFNLQKEKLLSLKENTELQNLVEQLQDELTLLRVENAENKRVVSEVKEKLSVQRTRYEQVRSDRTVKSFKLRQSKELIAEQQKKLIFMKQQIEQLKKEVISCEDRIITLSTEKEVIRKEKTKIGTTANERSLQIKNLKANITVMQNENDKLRQMMREGDVVRNFEHIRYNDMIRDRDLLGTQVIKRNDHIALLKKKVHIQQSIIKKGSFQYRQKEQDTRLLKLKIKELNFKIEVLQKRNTHATALKGALSATRNENQQLRQHLNVLEEQIGNPTNVHSWRIMAAKDESKHELMLKTQWLQKELLAKRQEVYELQEDLVEKDRVFSELKKKFKRLPGVDVQRQVSQYEDQIRKLKDKLRAATGEMNMFAFQMKEKDLSLKQFKMSTGRNLTKTKTNFSLRARRG